MKSPIEFPEEVATCSHSPPLTALLPNTAVTTHYKTIEDPGCDSDTDDTVLSSTESDSDDNNFPDFFPEDGTTTTIGAEHSSSSSQSPDQPTRRAVSFGPIHVRHYERIVGDHPVTRVGVPMAIGWAYYEDERYLGKGVSIERYETDRIRKGKSNLRMTSITRTNLLKNVFGIPEKELRTAEERVRKQRLRSDASTNQRRSLGSAGAKLVKRIRKGGMSLLTGMAYAGQIGLSGDGARGGL